MSLYIYSLGQAELLAGCGWPRGHGDARVELVTHGTLAAVVSELDVLPAPVQRRDLQLHDAVNRAVLATGLCIPMRWGTMVAGYAACGDLLAGHYERWQRTARRLHGRVELSAKIALARPAEPELSVPSLETQPPGTAYLRARQARLAAQTARDTGAEELGMLLKQSLDGITDSVSVTHRGGLMTLAALVRREQFALAAERLALQLSGVPDRWIIGEPWPPYSFVEEQP